MSRKRKKKVNNQPVVSVPVSSGISTEQWQHIMANAIVEAEEIKEQRKREAQEAEIAEWRRAIGVKDYSVPGEKLPKIKTAANNFICFLKICFIPKKHIKGDRMSIALLKMFLVIFFDIMKWSFLVFSAYCVYTGIAEIISAGNILAAMPKCLYAISIGMMVFIVSRMFRMAGIEVDKIEDRNFIFGLFGSVATVVSIIVTLTT